MSSFDKQFPAKGCYSKDVREFRRQGWLAALKWVVECRDFYRNERKLTGIGAASKVISEDIKKEIDTIEQE